MINCWRCWCSCMARTEMDYSLVDQHITANGYTNSIGTTWQWVQAARWIIICKKLWKLEIPAKIKIFGWRDLHGVIPSWTILANRLRSPKKNYLQIDILPMLEDVQLARDDVKISSDIKHMMFMCEKHSEGWEIRFHIVRRTEEVIQCGGQLRPWGLVLIYSYSFQSICVEVDWVKLKLFFTLIHSNTHGLMWIRVHPTQGLNGIEICQINHHITGSWYLW